MILYNALDVSNLSYLSYFRLFVKHWPIEESSQFFLYFRDALNLELLFFENFTVDFQISYFREKKLSGQIVLCFPVSTYKSQCFKEFYDGMDSPGLNRMGLKKEMRNENLFFKRITNIIIPDYPLSIDM